MAYAPDDFNALFTKLESTVAEWIEKTPQHRSWGVHAPAWYVYQEASDYLGNLGRDMQHKEEGR